VKRAVAIVVFLVVAFGAMTLVALESGGVGILETQAPDGSERTTHVWYAEDDGEVWIEAATPRRAFLHDLRRAPEVTLVRDGEPSAYHAEIRESAADHARIRGLLRDKYGLRDWYVGLLQDTSRSVAVVLHPLPR
jgi:hypothetical protein